MAFNRPTLGDLVTQIEADFVSRLDLVGALLRRAVVFIMSRVWAGATHMLHGHLAYNARQIFEDTCDDENLSRRAALRGLFKTNATFAQATILVTGTPAAPIPAGTILRRSDGAEYITNSDNVVAGGGTVVLSVTAAVAGSLGSLSVGVVLTFESPLTDVESVAPVSAAGISGSDEETTEALRTRLIAFLREPPRGGSIADWIAWAKEVPGVTRAWVTPQGLGPGTVVVRFVRDLDGDFIPDTDEVAAVQAHLDEVRPAASTPTAVAPVANPIMFALSITPDTPDTQAAVNAELTDLFRRQAAPGATMLLSQLHTAVGTAPGIVDFEFTSPSADQHSSENQIPTYGGAIFV